MRLFDPTRLPAFLLSALASVAVLVSVFYPLPFVDDLLRVAQLILAVGLVIGVANVIGVNLAGLRARMPGIGYRLVVVAAALAVLALELIPSFIGGDTGTTATAVSAAVFRYMYQPLAMSVLGLLVVFALLAAWRALSTRPGEAWIVVLVAVVFLVAGGPWASLLPGLGDTLTWITVYPANGVARGIVIGIGIAAIIATVRLLLGYDQPYLDR